MVKIGKTDPVRVPIPYLQVRLEHFMPGPMLVRILKIKEQGRPIFIQCIKCEKWCFSDDENVWHNKAFLKPLRKKLRKHTLFQNAPEGFPWVHKKFCMICYGKYDEESEQIDRSLERMTDFE